MKPQVESHSEPGLRSVGSEASVPTLIRQLAEDATSLISKEVQLAKAEVYQNINQVKQGLVSLASGALVLYAGVLVLLFSAVFGLATVVDLWLSALIIGAIVSLIGFALLGAAKKKMEASELSLDHTIESLKEDQRATKGALS